jgi:bacillithiol synthase
MLVPATTTTVSTSVGEPVKSDCIPYSAIPHTTKLFSDFLFDHEKVKQFFVRPLGTEWFADEARLVKYGDRQRAPVADILERQNCAWGASASTLENVARLRQGAVAIVTGQQVGLFGGPLYSLLKAASAIRTARDLTQKGIPAVPIFWLATEDHDLLEVNHAVLPAGAGQLRTLVSASKGKANAPVGTVQFSDEITQVVSNAAELLGESEATDFLVESYRAGETYGSAFARLFTKIFGEHGLVLLDPLDAELHKLAVPILRAAAENAVEIDRALLERGKQLRDAGYHEQVKVTPESTLLFSIANGERKVIHVANGGFMIGAEKISRDELLGKIDQRPEDFSPNVLLRPIVQDYLLPTVMYYGGAAELAYFAQVGVVYERLLGRVTPIQPRFSATLVDKRMQRLLARYKLDLPDLFRGAENLRERLASQVLPEKLHNDFEEAHAAVESAMKDIRASLQQLDQTLIDASERAERKMKYQLTRLHGRAARAELRRNSQLSRDADELLAGLFPHKMLQEREIPGIYYLAREGRGLIDRLIEAAGECCPSHQLLYL